jgi:hypothetical protein
MMNASFPNDTQRVAIIGRTGSGKTQAGIWHLSGQKFDRKPWLVINTKGDPLINDISTMPGVTNCDLNASVGKRGIYVVQPRPDQKDELDKFLWRIWARGNCGIYIDEGYMVTGIDSFDAMLTQGRSKHIPMIVLSQRPVWMSRFVFSEADFYQLFNLNLLDDRRKMAEYIRELDPEYHLPEYHSVWYDVAEDHVIQFAPVPSRERILETFKARLTPRKVLV